MAIVELDRSPGMAGLYRRAAAGLLPGRRPPTDALPDLELRLRPVTVDRARLAEYVRVCGFRLTDTLPVTYPHVLGFPLALQLLTDPGFPFPAVGAVHIANRIEARRPLAADEALELAVRAEQLREHPRGQQVDLVTEVSVAGEPVWREVSTYLHRTRRPAAQTSGEGGSPRTDQPGTGAGVSPTAGQWGVGEGEPWAWWRVEPEVTRAYARVSGDRNPIHTSGLAARGFGFRGRIAHGMWTKARALAQLGPRLPDAYQVAVTFRAPLPLGSTVAFDALTTDDGWEFAVRARSGKPHLTGAVQTLGN